VAVPSNQRCCRRLDPAAADDQPTWEPANLRGGMVRWCGLGLPVEGGGEP
jgi:hypothetical protein